MADEESSELSSVCSLSSAPSQDDTDIEMKSEEGILKFFHKLPAGTKPAEPKKEMSPPPRKRSPSPPHEYILADNTDVAFIVMFRARFNDALPKSLANFGPQELERDVTETIPGERVEHFLCAVLGLLLNRKQDVKPGHYNRALEDAISTHKNQWARGWNDENPLAGSNTFTSMNPTERLTLLRTLVFWTLCSSEVVKGIINKSYKGARHEDDLNQPLSVQPWGSDSDKRRYYLIEGLDDTHFRVYRESNPQGFNRTWWSVAGSIDELKILADKLQNQDGGPKARKLAHKMLAAVPRFEATEEKRKRREYRLMRKEQFKRPEPGYSMYEGRTRGKRTKYTYDDDDDDDDGDDTPFRRSSRNTRNPTPAEPSAPVTTLSGRQVKAPSRMMVDSSNNIVTTSPTTSYGNNDAVASKESSVGPTGRPKRSAAVNHGTNGWAPSSKKKAKDYASGDDEMEDYDDDDEEEEDDQDSSPEFGDDEEDERTPDGDSEDEDEFDVDEDDEMVNDVKQTMIIKLKLPAKRKSPGSDKPALNLAEYRYDGKKEAPKTGSSSDTKDLSADEDTPKDVISVATTKKSPTPEPTSTSPANGDKQAKHHPLGIDTKALLRNNSIAFREKHVGVGAGD
ncbi:hypothetical protein GGR54DRAFT_171840 [Hypoxylon sp. NC1633]|nr:hypothetical protein GGR54DRAFT_171840 [Hypoxylon sp. NC1633]